MDEIGTKRPDGVFWLPEDYLLPLTAFDLGWLHAKLEMLPDDLEINDLDENGNPVLTTMKAKLLKKLQKLLKQCYEESKEDEDDSGGAGNPAQEMQG